MHSVASFSEKLSRKSLVSLTETTAEHAFCFKITTKQFFEKVARLKAVLALHHSTRQEFCKNGDCANY